MAVKTLAILGLLAICTIRQQAVWSSDVTLWQQALTANATSARPALNLSVAYMGQARYVDALVALTEAARRIPTTPHDGVYRAMIRQQVYALEMVGIAPCLVSPSLQPYC